jgi:FAD/FMN-containing dehydrogenase
MADELRGQVAGTVLLPGDAGYDDARRIHNGLIDRSPAAIVQCTSPADAAAAIGFARGHGFELCVRGGGHNVAGRAVIDGAVMVDLSTMKGIEVDAAARTVRAEGGVTWGELNEATGAHGLAVTGGVISTTGIAGLTLGGGIGWLMPKLGAVVDNVLSIELVTADGETITASAGENADLFWALRGGGGNFGVATSFTYALHPIAQVVGGRIAFPLPAAGDLFRFLRDFARDIPDELMLALAVANAPDGSGFKLGAVIVCHCGDEEQAMADLAPLLEYGEPVLKEVGPMPYPVMNTLIDGNYPKGALNYWKSAFFAELSDEVIDAAVSSFAEYPSTLGGIIFEHFHGAITRIPEDATAWPHRHAGFNLVMTAEWTDPAQTDTMVAWTRETYAKLEPHAAGLRYVNYLDGDDSAATGSAFGPNFARLRDVKRQYDPDNVFHNNQNIPPS